MTDTSMSDSKPGEPLEAMAKTLGPILEGLKAFWAGIQANLEASMQVTLAFARQVNDALYDEYMAHGAIYGESQEGMLRWLEEVGEYKRLEAEAEQIRLRHQMLADFRAKTQRRVKDVADV